MYGCFPQLTVAIFLLPFWVKVHNPRSNAIISLGRRLTGASLFKSGDAQGIWCRAYWLVFLASSWWTGAASVSSSPLGSGSELSLQGRNEGHTRIRARDLLICSQPLQPLSYVPCNTCGSWDSVPGVARAPFFLGRKTLQRVREGLGKASEMWRASTLCRFCGGAPTVSRVKIFVLERMP